MEPLVRTGLLYDFYGGLLTAKQQKVMELYFLEDWSLAEIATQEAVSRQAVHDLIHRSARTMEEYESKLGLMGRFIRQQAELSGTCDQLTELLNQVNSESHLYKSLYQIKSKLEKLLENE
ncbi:MAG TPA: YlxM family DNA-binding protein [Bacillota bacterium]|nr:YlxM family DNA-binding protein [Bacillota bacterium]